MANQTPKQGSSGPNLKALGLKSPMEVFDILALLRIDGEPVIKEDKSLLDPKAKAQAVAEYFMQKFSLKLIDLPYLASQVKHDIKHGQIGKGIR